MAVVGGLGPEAGYRVLVVVGIALDGVQRLFRVIETANKLYVTSSLGTHTITRVPRFRVPEGAAQHGAAESPMPGRVLKILVSEGQPVKAGDALVILEAMKMEQTIRAGATGVIELIRVTVGQIVSPGDVLVQIVAFESS